MPENEPDLTPDDSPDANPQQPAPTSTTPAYNAPQTLFGVPLDVIVLTDGRKVLEVNALASLLAKLVDLNLNDQTELVAFQRWVEHLPPPPESD